MTMRGAWIFGEAERARVNPPIALTEDEPCDRCHQTLGDTAYTVRNPHGYNVFDILCEECVVPAERCSECQMFRCACRED